MNKYDKDVKMLHDALDGKRMPDAYDKLESAISAVKSFVKNQGWWLKLTGYTLLLLGVLILLGILLS